MVEARGFPGMYGCLGRAGLSTRNSCPLLPFGDLARPIFEVWDGAAQGQGSSIPVWYRCHRGAITGLVASPDGSLLFSTCSQGTLSQYHCVSTCSRVLHVAGQAPIPGPNPSFQSFHLQVPVGVGLA